MRSRKVKGLRRLRSIGKVVEGIGRWKGVLIFYRVFCLGIVKWRKDSVFKLSFTSLDCLKNSI